MSHSWVRHGVRAYIAGVFLSSSLVGTMLVQPGSPRHILAQSDCIQPAHEGCSVELGRPATAVLTNALDTHTWWLHLDTPGSLTILLGNLHADYGLTVVPVHTPLATEPAQVGDSVVYVAMDSASAGDYLIFVSARSGGVSEQPYLLLASWRPIATMMVQPVPEVPSPGPSSTATPKEARPDVQPPTRVRANVSAFAPSGPPVMIFAAASAAELCADPTPGASTAPARGGAGHAAELAHHSSGLDEPLGKRNGVFRGRNGRILPGRRACHDHQRGGSQSEYDLLLPRHCFQCSGRSHVRRELRDNAGGAEDSDILLDLKTWLSSTNGWLA